MRFAASTLTERLRGRLQGPDVECNGVATDSRALVPGQLFVALRDSRDGHQFIDEAVAAGGCADSGRSLASQARGIAMAKMTETEIGSFLAEQPEWHLDGGKLVRDWSFKDFVEAMLFVNRIAALAEQAGHHPDIDIRYNKVRLGLVTHDAGGLTGKDFDLAGKANTLA